MNAIEIRELTKSFRGARRRAPVVALDRLSLDVPAGTVFGLLGPNGAGKTTLVKTLLGLVRPGGGRADLLGRPCSDHRVRRRVGFLPEGQSYPEYCTGREYVAYMGRLAGLARAEARRRADAWLDRVGLREAAGRKVRTYSKGMCQRMGLAAAFAHDPELLFLDEPTDGVDPMGRKEIRDLIRDENAKGRTVFLNSHLLSEVDQICGHVAILNFGRLLAAGPLAEVKASSLGGAGPERGTAYGIETTGEDLRAALAGIPGIVEGIEATGTSCRLRLPAGAAGATEVIDHLRRAGIGLRRVQPLEPSLEERFLALIQDDNQRRFGGPA